MTFVPLRVAFDLDGVLADMESALVRQAVVLFGDGVVRRLLDSAGQPTARAIAAGGGAPDGRAAEATNLDDRASDDVPARLHLSARQERRLWRRLRAIDNFWETLDECEPGVVARLASIARDRRWEIIFLTKRPESGGATAQQQTQRWLASKGFTLPSVFVVRRSRGLIAASLDLDIVIDDRPENCLDVVVDSRARAILVWRADPKELPPATRQLGIGVVTTVNQCLDILTEVDETPARRAGLLDRVMDRLGLETPRPAKPFDSSNLEVTQQAEPGD